MGGKPLTQTEPSTASTLCTGGHFQKSFSNLVSMTTPPEHVAVIK